MEDEFAMVLSGGGAKGAYQVGAFRALGEYPVRIKCVSGSSVGGINAYAFAALTQEEIESLWKDFGLEDFIRLDDDWSDGLSDRKALEEILDKIVTQDRLEKCIPVYNTICSNSMTADYRKLNDMSKENAVKTILATSALPFIYSSVNIGGVNYQDGGLADNLPVMPVYESGYRNLIVIGLSENLRIDRYKFPVDNLIEMFPSKNLGELFDGTLNFDEEYISFAMKLGYMDARRSLNNYYGIENGCHTVQFDYEQIMRELRTEKLQKSIDGNMDKLMKYFD